MVRIVQYPAHVGYQFKVGSELLSMRELCVDGVSVRAATEAAIGVLQTFGIRRVEILRVDGTRFEMGIPS